jgi:hypothetical protein
MIVERIRTSHARWPGNKRLTSKAKTRSPRLPIAAPAASTLAAFLPRAEPWSPARSFSASRAFRSGWARTRGKWAKVALARAEIHSRFQRLRTPATSLLKSSLRPSRHSKRLRLKESRMPPIIRGVPFTPMKSTVVRTTHPQPNQEATLLKPYGKRARSRSQQFCARAELFPQISGKPLAISGKCCIGTRGEKRDNP